ncbi:hypothetical protein OPQ81_009118 [Rhizoctonia solani]|nr:hypothetical protein OPQ81_009118 [Rhizoctonia solani]
MAFLKSYSWALRTFQALRAQGMLQTLKPHRSGFPNISRQQSRKIHPYTPNRQDHCCRTNEHRRQKCTDRFYLIAWTQPNRLSIKERLCPGLISGAELLKVKWLGFNTLLSSDPFPEYVGRSPVSEVKVDRMRRNSH